MIEKFVHRILTCLVIILCGSTLLFGDPDFSVIINATGGGINYDLRFGFSPEATDGYDGGFCSAPQWEYEIPCEDAGETWTPGFDEYAPPAPPTGFDAALGWENERYRTQILNGSANDLTEHIWDIELQFPNDSLVTLTWDTTGLSFLGNFILQDAFDGIMINVDMTQISGLTLDNPAFTLLKLKVTPNDVVMSVTETFYPDDFILFSNYPNPFNPETTIAYKLKMAAHVQIIVYDIRGNEIIELVDDFTTSDVIYRARWDGRDSNGKEAASGIYFVCLIANNNVFTKKLTLLR